MTSATTIPTETSPAELENVLATAQKAAGPLAALRPAERAELLRAAADALDAATEELVPQAMSESGLTQARLTGEVGRSSGQLRMFAAELEDGTYLEPIIDTATSSGRPDLRRMLIPLGPVLVFAASNFPFAFSVPGGDTASALAAGCPVVVKAHPGHPQLSQRVGDLLAEALRAAGAPEGTLSVVHGESAGADALRDSRITAAAFTGSESGGKALLEIANSRPEPIPFYGELGSLNPAFVTPSAWQARATEIIDGYVGSFTLGAGQFCTKPGLLFLPSGHGRQQHIIDAVERTAPATMLNERIHQAHAAERDRLAALPGMRPLARSCNNEDQVGATLLETTVPELLDNADAALTECFGPTSIVVTYEDTDQLQAAAAAFGGTLTATVHCEIGTESDADTEVVRPLLATLRARAGRVVFNGWPTGVAVTAAMHHGGPYPATTASVHTSVGTTALRRFLRPVCYQDTPAPLLPEPLADDNPLGLSRRINGEHTAAVVSTR
ncbi:NADP-dependent aldehyde dehydrogenase [Halopolyspora algeriensis]|uniref:NADP-dependent aldehyde dehydrogenase n=1 Tax=Halopolyspora algeriensis TaxID=1500506 RepID=A0A368VWX2_9ACTN|nr:aldehyde dehydrogenase (NADP(+)) [Halopolyspora algeriensis]RCW45807.1 NADP-dependent aldehyde dehydrogenase [Halopolyspora algeriensis]TQM54191.1 NADP-dependent aldehyde dehydrogenase [Halopolyspora algeriensis]